MQYDPICVHCYFEDNLVSAQGCYLSAQCKHKVPEKKFTFDFVVVMYCLYIAYVSFIVYTTMACVVSTKGCFT